MRALEFSTSIEHDHILIPDKICKIFQSEFTRKVRVIVLFEENDKLDEMIVQESLSNYFLNGYEESDSIYDNYK